MRKFFIATALTALATVGIGIGTASAEPQDDVEHVVEVVACPWNNAADENSGGQLNPAESDPSGMAAGRCDDYPAISEDYLIPDYIPCDVLKAVGDAAANNGVPAVPDVTNAVRDAVPCEVDTGCTENCGGNPKVGDDDDDDDDDDGAEVKDDVVQNNAASDGSLPRTGGELQLLGGLSMGLTGLGLFARRFLG